MGILDEFIQGVNREINRVQARSQEMLQTYNLNSQIRNLEGKKTAALIEIGRLIFEKFERNVEVTDDQLRAKVREIVVLDSEIIALQADLEVLKAQFDPDIPASQKAAAKAGYTATPGFQCPHCQAPASMEKAFCPACGGSLKESHGVIKTEGNGGTSGGEEGDQPFD